MQKYFVHMLLFECPGCGAAIATTLTSEHGSPEEADREEIALRCECDWTGQVLGFAAKRHFVIDWEQAPPSGSGPVEDFRQEKTGGGKKGARAEFKGMPAHLPGVSSSSND
jgi:hypothetical protein